MTKFQLKDFKKELGLQKFSYSIVHSGIMGLTDKLSLTDIGVFSILSYFNNWKADDGVTAATFTTSKFQSMFGYDKKTFEKSIQKLIELNILINNNDVISVNCELLTQISTSILPTKTSMINDRKKGLITDKYIMSKDLIALTNKLINANVAISNEEQDKLTEAILYVENYELINSSTSINPIKKENTTENKPLIINNNTIASIVDNKSLNKVQNEEIEDVDNKLIAKQTPTIQIENFENEAKIINSDTIASLFGDKALNAPKNEENNPFTNVMSIVKQKYSESNLVDKITQEQWLAFYLDLMNDNLDLKLDAMVGVGNIDGAKAAVVSSYSSTRLAQLITKFQDLEILTSDKNQLKISHMINRYKPLITLNNKIAA